MKGIIYKATNTFNGKVYIGQTVAGLPKRRAQHIRDARADEDNLFHFALYQYPNGFTWDVIDTFEGDREEVIHALNVAEEYHILKFRSSDTRFGYNSTRGGYSSDKFSEHIKARAMSTGGSTKQILQYAEDGNFVQEFSSLNAVAAHLGKEKIHLKVLLGGLHYGYQWRVKKNEYYPKTIGPYNPQKKPTPPVVAYDRCGRLYKEFPSEIVARRALGDLPIRTEIMDIEVQERFERDFYLFRKGDGVPPETINITIKHKKKHTSGKPSAPIPVLAYDAKSGEFVAEYPSIAEAHNTTGAATQTITCFLRLKPPYTIISPKTNFVWVRKEGEIAQSVDIVPFIKKIYENKMEHRIIQYTLDGEFVRVWDNTHRAAESGADSAGLIRKCLTGKFKSPKLNYQWVYYTQDYSQNIGKMEKAKMEEASPGATRPDERIEEVDKSGRVIAVYKDTADAAEKSGFSQSYICNVLSGRIRHPKRKFRRG